MNTSSKAFQGGELLVDHIKSLGYTSDEDIANFDGTPDRISKVFCELIMPLEELKTNLKNVLSTCFPMTGDPGIVIQDCVTIGMCPHHLLPIIHQMYVGYMPKNNGHVLGMSKLIRIADSLSRRAVLQEKLAIDITATLYGGYYDDEKQHSSGLPSIETNGSICVMGSMHGCMSTRGVRSFSLAREVSVRGVFQHDKNIKDEAFKIIQQFPSTQFPLK